MKQTTSATLKRLFVPLVALVLLASACGDDEASSVGAEPSTSVTFATTSSTVVTSPSTNPNHLDLTLLSVDYGCGYGFAIGSPDQDLKLVIYANDGSFGSPPDVTAPINFPSPDWTGEVQVGTDLFANWCDDVIEPDEPTPVVEERLALIGGKLIIDGDHYVVSGLLRDGVVERAGEQIALPDELTLTNSGWGSFAG